MHETTHSRRGFLAALAGSIAPIMMGWSPDRVAATAPAAPRAGHPDPRPGIDASRVLKAEDVDAEFVELYDHIRAIPHVVDGVRCYCGCADLDGFYSLLSCYEESGMAQECHICQGAGRLVHRLHTDGRSLDEIRAAIDRRFG